ncbi:hypothetical protein T310_10156 [Rasamsonia emersonii CBS 393.64]|uniref:Uncharacterized protein n=1 Tax=Rasamsonia emersonii (strain ATCC 16479 / CBS 393.64 / IMI 116815) TaxID=1408163 RepID=A0A0F4YDJ5_RASE3|nr:hypothetical protein T310_10156 [Rasamsonia emersonii CBS 393.64]KKA16254.1 hypothetical protein T310_10156 [Rasamsonia emersonii CBS 393.64]
MPALTCSLIVSGTRTQSYSVWLGPSILSTLFNHSSKALTRADFDNPQMATTADASEAERWLKTTSTAAGSPENPGTGILQQEFPIPCPCTAGSPTCNFKPKGGLNLLLVPAKLESNWVKEWESVIDKDHPTFNMRMYVGHSKHSGKKVSRARWELQAAGVKEWRDKVNQYTLDRLPLASENPQLVGTTWRGVHCHRANPAKLPQICGRLSH